MRAFCHSTYMFKRIALCVLWSAVLMAFASSARGQEACAGAGTVNGSTGCAILITVTGVDANGNATLYTIANPGSAYDPGQDDFLVGIVNNSGSTLNSITLTTAPGSPDPAFALDKDGPCFYNKSDCYPNNGPTGYEGPNTSFTAINGKKYTGTALFNGGLATGLSTWFALEGRVIAADACAQALPVGTATGCGVLITVLKTDGNNNATAYSITNTGNGNPYDTGKDDWLVGVVNQSGSPLSFIPNLSTDTAHSPDPAFAFDKDGPCLVNPYDCFNFSNYKRTGYEGPITTFTVGATTNTGTVNFQSPLAPQTSTWFALEGLVLPVGAPQVFTPPIDATSVPAVTSFTQDGGPVLAETLDFTSTHGTNCPIGCTNLQVLTTNLQISPTDLIPYVKGGPYATALPTPHSGNGGDGTIGSMFINSCFGGTSNIPISQASDKHCPTGINAPGTYTNFVGIIDTFDQNQNALFQIPPGTTVALIAFDPSNSALDWLPDTSSSPTNPQCTSTAGIATTVGTQTIVSTPGCNLPNILSLIYGDQTQTKGSKPPKNARKLHGVYNVPVTTLVTNVLPNAKCPSVTSVTALNYADQTNPSTFGTSTPAASGWFNGACGLGFVATPATPLVQCSSGSNDPCHGFAAAPVAFLNFGPGTAPGPDGDPAPSPFVNPNLTTPAVWDTSQPPVAPITLSTLLPTDGPNQPIHSLAVDTIGSSNFNFSFVSPSNGGCPIPGTNPQAFTNDPTATQCYVTGYYSLNLNIDSSKPTLGLCSLDPKTIAGSNGWFKNDVIQDCSATDGPSGIGSANGATVNPAVVAPNPFYFKLATTVGSGPSNTATTPSETLCDLANNCTPQPSFGPYGIDGIAGNISVGFSSNNVNYPNGATIPAGYPVNVVYTCSDNFSGVGICAGQPVSCPSAPALGNVAPQSVSAPVTNIAPGGPYNLSPVSTTDCAGNVSASVTPTYSIQAAGPDLQLCELPGSPSPCASTRTDKVKPGSTLIYFSWGANLSTSTTANNVILTESFPTSVLPAGAAAKAIAGVVSFTKGGQCPLIATGASCGVSSSGGTTTVTCAIAKLPASTSKTTTAAAVLLTIPVSSTLTSPTPFTLTGKIVGSGDPNTNNNTVVDNVTVSK